jgi:hypothetical protein
LVPCFHRVYTISLQHFKDASCLTCDCKYFECNGMVCQHLAHVKRYYAAKPDITHHDISVRWWKAYLYFSMKNEQDFSSSEKQIKQQLESIRRNDCKGPSFSEKLDDHIRSPFCCVYRFGKHSNDKFRNATESSLMFLFRQKKVMDQVINYSRDEVMVALKHSSTNIPLSMSQEVYLQDESSGNHYDSDGRDKCVDDGNDECLIESTVGSDCIDFWCQLHHEDEFPDAIYNPYDLIIPRAKELVSIVSASKNCRECGILVEQALDKIILEE